jgi:hypothetical protein
MAFELACDCSSSWCQDDWTDLVWCHLRPRADVEDCR